MAPVWIVAGLWLSFIQPFYLPERLPVGFALTRFLLILAATALPEEILFRSLIQDSIMQKVGFTNAALLLASAILVKLPSTWLDCSTRSEALDGLQ